MKAKNCVDCRNMRVKLPLKVSENYLNIIKNLDALKSKLVIDWSAIAKNAFLSSRLLYREATAKCMGGNDKKSLLFNQDDIIEKTFEIGSSHYRNKEGGTRKTHEYVYESWKFAEQCHGFDSMDD